MAGLVRHPFHPRHDRRVGGEIKTALARDVRVRVEADVGDRVMVGDQERMVGQPLLQNAQCRLAALFQTRQLGPARASSGRK